MKLVSRILSLLVITGLAAFIVGCDGGDDPKKSDQDVQLSLLNGTWNATESVTFNGSQPALDHKEFVLKINAQPGDEIMSFTVENRPTGPSAWPANGTFSFGANVKTDLLRKDSGGDVAISYTVDKNSLVMKFTFTGDAYQAGRTSSITGDWVFEFTKQTN